jgi:hypothetical protein
MIRRVLEAINEDDDPELVEVESYLRSRGWMPLEYVNLWKARFRIWIGPYEDLYIRINEERASHDSPFEYDESVVFYTTGYELGGKEIQTQLLDPKLNRARTVDSSIRAKRNAKSLGIVIRKLVRKHGLKYRGKRS